MKYLNLSDKMDFKKINSVYFLGIGGIGMSALARYFLANGKNVGGYDKTSTQLTSELIKQGMNIHFEDMVQLIPKEYLQKDSTLVVRTPAVPDDHSEYNYFKYKGFRSMKRAEVLGIIFNAKKGLKVGAEMVRIANGAKVGPSFATVTQSGHVIRDFSFTNTEETWPAGDYRINVATSNKQYASVPFKIK